MRESLRACEKHALGLAAFKKRWPTAAADDQNQIDYEWYALTAEEGEAALVGISPFLEELKRHKRTHPPTGWKYLHQKRWTLLRAANAKPSSSRANIREGLPQWRAWDVFYRCCGKSTGIPGYAITGERGSRTANVPQEWPPLVGDDPGEGNWRRFSEGSPEFAAWRRRLRELDPHLALPAVLTVPSQWPPAKHATADPPETLTEEDVRELSKMA